MENKKKILFIVNPISGIGKQKTIPELIHSHIDRVQYDYSIAYTKCKGDATRIAKEAILEKIDIIVAVGGDGSINEIAQSIVNTDIILGIIPSGSGNGLANHLKIPLKINKAIGIINNNKIAKIISDAIAKANKKTGKKSSGFVLTAETKLIAQKFEGNKGKLPWPVDRGFVSTRFGKQRHPIYKNNEIQSNGVRITTEKGSYARAIFEGEVKVIQLTTGNRKTVYVQHGNYITLYKGLENISVKTGDKVSTKQVLGKIYTDKLTNKTILSFQVWKNTTPLNPAYWVYKM